MESQTTDRANYLRRHDRKILVIDFEKLAATEKIMTSQKNEKRVLGYLEVQSSKLDDDKLFIQEIDYEGQPYYDKGSTSTAPIYMVVPNDTDGGLDQNINKGFPRGDINSSLRVENMHVTLMDDNTMSEDCIDEPTSEECSEYVPVFISTDDLTDEINANGPSTDISSYSSEKEETDVLFIPCSQLASTLKLPKNVMKLSKTVFSEQRKTSSVSEQSNVSNFAENVEFSDLPEGLNVEQQSSDMSVKCDQNVDLNSDSNQVISESKQAVDTVTKNQTRKGSKLMSDNVHDDDNDHAQGSHAGASSDDDDDDLFFFSTMHPKKSKLHKNLKNSKSRTVLLHSNVSDSAHENVREHDLSDSDNNSRESWDIKSAPVKEESLFSQEPKTPKKEDTTDWEEFVRSPPVSCKKETKTFAISPSKEKGAARRKSRIPSFLQRRLQHYSTDHSSDLEDSFIHVRLQVPSPEPTTFYECSNCDFKCHYLDNLIFHYQQCPSSSCSRDKTSDDLDLVYNDEEIQDLVTNIKQYIWDGKIDDFVVGIYKGTVQSERHKVYFGNDADAKQKLADDPWFGPITGNDSTLKIFDHFYLLFKKLFEDGEATANKYLCYVYQVWIPEAIIKAISLIKDISISEAGKVFTESMMRISDSYS